MADLLFDGRLAIAADGWSGLGDAVLIAAPQNPVSLFRELSRDWPSESAGPLRMYALKEEHVLATDGRVVWLGRRSTAGALFVRCIEMAAKGRATLATTPGFQLRVGALPPDAQVLFYADTSGSSAIGVTPQWWPAAWPQLDATAAALTVTTDTLRIDLAGDLQADAPLPLAQQQPLHRLAPSSTLLMWTQPMSSGDFAGAGNAPLSAVWNGVLPAKLRKPLRARAFADETQVPVFVILSRLDPKSRRDGSTSGSAVTLAAAVVLTLPASVEPGSLEAWLAEQTRDVGGGAEMMPRPGLSVGAPRSERIYRLPLVDWEPPLGGYDLSSWLLPGWMIIDQQLIFASHVGLLEDIVQVAAASRIDGPEADSDDAQADSRELVSFLRARPKRIGRTLEQWLEEIGSKRPEMLEPRWWDRLRRRERESQVQLGIIPSPSAVGVKVGETMEGYPAHRRLLVGDVIMSVDGRALDSANPRVSLRERLAGRKDPAQVVLGIRRENAERDVTIPMPTPGGWGESVSSIEAVRGIGRAIQLFEEIQFTAWHESEKLLRGRLELTFDTGARQR